MSNETLPHEKRAFFRMRFPGKVLISFFDSDQKLECQCINISANGLLFESATEIPANTRVEVEILSAEPGVLPLRSEAIVIRCQPVLNSDLFEIALEMDLPDNKKPT